MYKPSSWPGVRMTRSVVWSFRSWVRLVAVSLCATTATPTSYNRVYSDNNSYVTNDMLWMICYDIHNSVVG